VSEWKEGNGRLKQSICKEGRFLRSINTVWIEQNTRKQEEEEEGRGMGDRTGRASNARHSLIQKGIRSDRQSDGLVDSAAFSQSAAQQSFGDRGNPRALSAADVAAIVRVMQRYACVI
jgi:hypothetical protein